MHKENQLSTCLLLLVLGFLIYQLVKNCGSNEKFTDEEEEVEEAFEEKEVEEEEGDEDFADVTVSNPTTITQQVMNQQPVMVDSVFNFEPNDNFEAGATLDNAFQRPIPDSARPDVVDINKNNVKKYDAKDFLPKEINDQWFDTDFSQAKFNVNDDKLINTERYVIGINTVGQSLKNASYDLRGSTPCPKFAVSPWSNSTIEPDTNLKSLC